MSEAKINGLDRLNEAKALLQHLKHQGTVNPESPLCIMKLAEALAAAEQQGKEAAGQAWVAFDAADDSRRPISGNRVQFVTFNGVTVGYRNDDGSWYDCINIGADGTPNYDYDDEQVTHWAPLLTAPPSRPEVSK